MADLTVPLASQPSTLVRPRVASQRVPRFRIPRLARRVTGPVLVIVLWQAVCSAHVFTAFELASPLAVVDAGRQLWAAGALQSAMLISLERVVRPA
jgi:sulfonate transport system permease protein